MAKDQMRMPMSTAGITSFSDEYGSKFVFKPGHIVVMIVVVILIVVALHLWASGFLV